MTATAGPPASQGSAHGSGTTPHAPELPAAIATEEAATWAHEARLSPRCSSERPCARRRPGPRQRRDLGPASLQQPEGDPAPAAELSSRAPAPRHRPPGRSLLPAGLTLRVGAAEGRPAGVRKEPVRAHRSLGLAKRSVRAALSPPRARTHSHTLTHAHSHTQAPGPGTPRAREALRSLWLPLQAPGRPGLGTPWPPGSGICGRDPRHACSPLGAPRLSRASAPRTGAESARTCADC